MSRLIASLLAAVLLTTICTGRAEAQEGAHVPNAPPTCTPSRRVHCPTAAESLAAANESARQSPVAGSFVRARQIYVYEPGALYRLYASPNHVSVILLEPGEAITAIAAGDTSRWMVTEAEAEGERAPRAVILVKPSSPDIETNIAIITDRRTYLVEAEAVSGDRYAAEVAWRYTESEATTVYPAPETLNFGYRVRTTRGPRPSWAPVRVFDDGRRTWIEFPADVEAGDLPPLFVITPEGAELVNYRVQGARYVIDRMFDTAELRLGVRAPVVVRIERGALEQDRRVRSGRRRP